MDMSYRLHALRDYAPMLKQLQEHLKNVFCCLKMMVC